MEIHYQLGLEAEAKKYDSVLGYNYNSSKWFEQSYKILNKDYKFTNVQAITMLPKKWYDGIKTPTPIVASNVINMDLINEDGKIIDNRDEKASKIIFFIAKNNNNSRTSNIAFLIG